MSLFKFAILATGIFKFLSVASKKLIFKLFHRNTILKSGLEVRK